MMSLWICEWPNKCSRHGETANPPLTELQHFCTICHHYKELHRACCSVDIKILYILLCVHFEWPLPPTRSVEGSVHSESLSWLRQLIFCSDLRHLFWPLPYFFPRGLRCKYRLMYCQYRDCSLRSLLSFLISE